MNSATDLRRFVSAHDRDYARALAEIRTGCKVSHWMWYIFPQLRGLGRSDTAQHYGIRDLEEAGDYLRHPVLGAHLLEITEALTALRQSDAHAVFGTPDDLKLRSSMTLFSQVPGAPPVFEDVLNQYFDGLPDAQTLRLLA